ncbi:MAG: FkbM family methyltransferase [Bacteroidota bacterium]
MSIKTSIQKWLARQGVYLHLLPPKEIRRRMAALQEYRITTVLDVGANTGQYAAELRQYGYKGTIHSYEPLSSAFPTLLSASKKYTNSFAHQLALGSEVGEGIINISQNSWSSSLRELLSTHLEGAPESAYVGQEKISISTVDEEFSRLNLSDERIWLKVDTQGFEREVLAGSKNSLSQIMVVQTEISLQPLYAEGMELEEALEYFKERGYRLIGLEPGFYNKKSGQLLQVDGIFAR